MPTVRFAHETSGNHFGIRCWSDEPQSGDAAIEYHAHVTCGDVVLSVGRGDAVGAAVKEAAESAIAELTALLGAFAAREETVAHSLELHEGLSPEEGED